MAIILLVLLLAIILGGLGFAVHVLWWIALAILVIWLIGFLIRMGEGTSRGRWYRWLQGLVAPGHCRGRPNLGCAVQCHDFAVQQQVAAALSG